MGRVARWRPLSVFANESAQSFLDADTLSPMDALSDLESRVLGVLEQRPGLDIEQVASAGRLPIARATQAVDSLMQKELVRAEDARHGRTFQLNRRNVQALLVA